MGKDSAENRLQSDRVRLVLRAGSIVFGLSAVLLIAAPAVFNSLLGLTNGADLEWAMQMIGITLVALSGNMFSVSTRGSDDSVLFSARVMLVSAFGLGVLTLLIPVQLTWFTIAYAIVGFGFSGAYAVALFAKTKR
jgi:O-antigen/teichoic acid export membrane protein